MTTADEVVAVLDTLAETYSRPPSRAQVASSDELELSDVHDAFGSWEEALEAAGFGDTDPVAIRASVLAEIGAPIRGQIIEKLESNDSETFVKGQLLLELHRLKQELGKSPSIVDMRNYGDFSDSTYLYHFDQWSDALRRAGIEPNAAPERVPDEELLAEIRRVAEQVGGQPRIEDMQDLGQYSAWTIYNRYDSWDEACREAGVSTS